MFGVGNERFFTTCYSELATQPPGTARRPNSHRPILDPKQTHASDSVTIDKNKQAACHRDNKKPAEHCAERVSVFL